MYGRGTRWVSHKNLRFNNPTGPPFFQIIHNEDIQLTL